VAADVERIGRIARDFGGQPVENSIPKILRANPFPPPNSMLGPEGERWVPVHGFLPHSQLADCWTAIQDLYRERAGEMQARKVEAGAMFAAVSASAALIEPVFFWPGALNPLHEAAVEPAHLAKLPRRDEDEAATALVRQLRTELITLFERFGATHLQIARTYPLKRAHDPAGWALLEAVKRQLDPRGLMNPGCLGL
jgi:FAD/FMN-containing dehydrogenase